MFLNSGTKFQICIMSSPSSYRSTACNRICTIKLATKNLHLILEPCLLKVIVPKVKGEPLAVVVVESGWGSMVPTVILANMSQSGPAARCGQLNIGDQIMSINGVSLVGLPLSTCQNYIKVDGHFMMVSSGSSK